MGVLKFRAFNKQGKLIQAEIHVDGTFRGFTKTTSENDWFETETKYNEEHEWYAKYDGRTIDSGKAIAGKITVTEVIFQRNLR
ncbi:MAG: hypothetical protein LBC74_12275 [Planctomycetaceae bacterium]|jgi:hypothetical protein|nr:hypothetical protein [Planctomycetaceae bacterium]